MTKIEIAHQNGSTVYEPHEYVCARLLDPDVHQDKYMDAFRVWKVDPNEVDSPEEGEDYIDYEMASIINVDTRISAEDTDPK